MIAPDTQRLLDTATAYFLAAERCAPEFEFGKYKLHTVGAPTITNYAFSIELCLKLIHWIVLGSAAKVHSLRKLFQSLPENCRNNLPHLEECVDDIDTYFEDWRYPYEKDFLTGDFDNPRRAFIECYREVRRLRPKLASVYERNWGNFDPDWVKPWRGNECS